LLIEPPQRRGKVFSISNQKLAINKFLQMGRRKVPPLRRRWRSGSGRDDRVGEGGKPSNVKKAISFEIAFLQ
jgi:hypothetical protein